MKKMRPQPPAQTFRWRATTHRRMSSRKPTLRDKFHNGREWPELLRRLRRGRLTFSNDYLVVGGVKLRSRRPFHVVVFNNQWRSNEQ